jgi:hypothetical protein
LGYSWCATSLSVKDAQWGEEEAGMPFTKIVEELPQSAREGAVGAIGHQALSEMPLAELITALS